MKTLYFIFAITLFVLSCKKEENNENNELDSFRIVKQESYTSDGSVRKSFYD